MNKMHVALITIGSVTIALLIIGIVFVIGLTEAVKEQDYRQCMDARGVYDTTDIDEMVDISDVCYSGVYGD